MSVGAASSNTMAVATVHSITSSARARSVGGTSRPRILKGTKPADLPDALAVLRLIASSNLVSHAFARARVMGSYTKSH
jgi:hypothetical protein